jgi:mono/diheme cytochrome c family protein
MRMNKRAVLLLMLVIVAGCAPRSRPDTPAAAGEALFGRWCVGCHTVEPGGTATLGPNLAGVASRAAANPDGLDAVAWLRRETLQPDAVLAPDFAAGLMPATYEQSLSAAEIDALVAYMLTLE